MPMQSTRGEEEKICLVHEEKANQRRAESFYWCTATARHTWCQEPLKGMELALNLARLHDLMTCQRFE